MGVTAAVAVVAGGAGFSAYSKMKAGSDQKKMFDRNAQFAEYQAEDAVVRGAYEERIKRRSTEQMIGEQRVQFAAQHVDVNLGSAMEVQESTAYLGELDALTIRNNAAKEAYGYRVEAQDLIQQGKYAKERGQMEAISTILGAAGSVGIASMGGGTAGSRPTTTSSSYTGAGSTSYTGGSNARYF